MNRSIKTKWLSALRGGEYLQGQGSLKKRGIDRKVRYCCLGVLASCQGKRPRSKIEGGLLQNLPTENFLKSCGLSTKIAKKLAWMNDASGKYLRVRTFKQIANWIEGHL